ncbi:hypothetical protein [Mesobacillus maritimus]
MTNRNDNRNQPHTGSKGSDTEFSSEQGMSKKERKRAARDARKK